MIPGGGKRTFFPQVQLFTSELNRVCQTAETISSWLALLLSKALPASGSVSFYFVFRQQRNAVTVKMPFHVWLYSINSYPLSE